MMRDDRRNRLQSIILDPNKAAVVFYLASAAAGLALLPGWHTSHRSLVIALVLIGCTLFAAFLRLKYGHRLSPLGTQIAGTAAIGIVSAAAAMGPSLHANLAVLYIWVAVYAALYFRPVAIVLQTGAAGVAYAIVLLAGHSSLRAEFLAWISIFGTAVVLATVVYGLVATLLKYGREDPLTGLPNRRSWEERADEELERARRNRTSLSLVSIDVDDFKLVNDRQGHQAGDDLLRQLADRWRMTTRGGGDFVARLGGDEFGLLAPGSDVQEIQSVVKRLQEALPEGVSCSLGVATWDGTETATVLFRRADEAMYAVKRQRHLGRLARSDESD
jgi:diguanylate cyclase (GGDEF)-like protein